MTTITVPVFIQATRVQPWKANYGEYKMDANSYSARAVGRPGDVLETTVTFDVPDDWNPVPEEIAALQAKANELMAETQIKLNTINDTISKLQALTYEAA